MTFWSGVGLHLGLELAGQAVLVLATRHLCRHRWHRWGIWAAGTLGLAVLTVSLLG